MNRDEIIKRVGLRIRDIRESQNMTIMNLADKLDIEYNNMIRIEKGRTNPTLGTLIKISQALNVRLIDILNVD